MPRLLTLAVLALVMTATGTAEDWACTCPVHPAGALHTYLLEPCRFHDTRDTRDPLLNDQVRRFRVRESCGVPLEAKGAILNVVIAKATGYGHLTFWDGVKPLPLASTINFQPAITLANATTVSLAPGTGPDFAIRAYIIDSPPATVDIVIDVIGYLS